MSNPGPAQGGSTNPQTVTGGEAGTIVGHTATETVGFYGDTGAAQQTVAITGNATVDSAATITALKALGLFA